VPNAEMYVLCLNNVEWQELDSLTVDLTTLLTLNGTYSISVKARANGYLDSNNSNAISYVVTNGENPDPVLENNSWPTIRLICESGQANTYWSVGDTKTDLGADGNTRTFRIVDMQGLYNKHVVFEQVEIDVPPSGGSNSYWSRRTGTPYKDSNMVSTVLPAILQRYSSVLQNSLTPTSVGAVSSMSDSSLDYTNYKLFLAAAKELTVAPADSNDRERQNLITFQYYVLNSAESDRIKYPLSGELSYIWWTRTLNTSYSEQAQVTLINTRGKFSTAYPNNGYYVAPCFAF